MTQNQVAPLPSAEGKNQEGPQEMAVGKRKGFLRKRSPKLAAPLDIFVINTGWDDMPQKVMKTSVGILKNSLRKHNLYVLTPEQSSRFLTQNPDFAGRDPIILVFDQQAFEEGDRVGFGAALVLGPVSLVLENVLSPYRKKLQSQNMIRAFLRVINKLDGSLSIAEAVKKFTHKEGVRGTLEIVFTSLGQAEGSYAGEIVSF